MVDYDLIARRGLAKMLEDKLCQDTIEFYQNENKPMDDYGRGCLEALRLLRGLDTPALEYAFNQYKGYYEALVKGVSSQSKVEFWRGMTSTTWQVWQYMLFLNMQGACPALIQGLSHWMQYMALRD